MFSKKVTIGIVSVLIFLAAVAFIIGKPPHRDARLYPIIRNYTPFVVEKSIGGLVIKRKDDKEFKEEPNAVDFYSRMQQLEREWAKSHLRIVNQTLEIVDDSGKTLKTIGIKSDKEYKFLTDYYGVKK